MKALLSHNFRLNFSDDKNHNDIKRKAETETAEPFLTFYFKGSLMSSLGKGKTSF